MSLENLSDFQKKSNFVPMNPVCTLYEWYLFALCMDCDLSYNSCRKQICHNFICIFLLHVSFHVTHIYVGLLIILLWLSVCIYDSIYRYSCYYKIVSLLSL